MIKYIEEQLRKGYEFYLNVDNLSYFQAIFKRNGNIVNINRNLLESLYEYENLYNSLLDNSKYIKIVFDNEAYILKRYAIIKKGIYGGLSKYGVEKEMRSLSLNTLFDRYNTTEKTNEKVL